MDGYDQLTLVDLETREAWLRERKLGIGASEAASLVTVDGKPVSNWGSPYSVFVDKCTDSKPDEPTERQLVWGTILEPGIRATVERRLALPVDYPGPFAICWKDASEDQPRFQFASLDGILKEPNELVEACFDAYVDPVVSGPGVVELKSDARPRWADPPLNYICQVQHQLSVTGFGWGLLCVFFSISQEIVIYGILRDEDMIRKINRTEYKFWRDHVLTKVPPKPDGTQATRAAIAEYYDEPNDEIVDMPESLQRLVTLRADIKGVSKGIDDEIVEIDNQIKAALGNASIGIFPDGQRVTWKQQSRAEHVVAASTFRVLRFAKT